MFVESKFVPLIADPTFSFPRSPPLAQRKTPTQTFFRYETQLLDRRYCSFQADQENNTVSHHSTINKGANKSDIHVIL